MDGPGPLPTVAAGALARSGEGHPLRSLDGYTKPFSIQALRQTFWALVEKSLAQSAWATYISAVAAIFAYLCCKQVRSGQRYPKTAHLHGTHLPVALPVV